MKRPPRAHAFQPSNYLVALESFSVTVDGEHQRFIAGQSRVISGHAAVLAAPAKFALEDSPAGQRAVARTTSNRSAATPPAEARPPWDLGPSLRPRSRDDETPKVSSAPSRVKVALSASARETIVTEAQASRDGRETGGPILGRRYFSWHPCVDACIAAGPGHGKRERSGLCRDLAHRIALREQIQRETEDREWTETGCWHTHPSQQGEPSGDDVRAWLSDLDALDNRMQLGVVLTEDRHFGWARPQFHCYLVSRSRWGEARVERAEIV